MVVGKSVRTTRGGQQWLRVEEEFNVLIFVGMCVKLRRCEVECEPDSPGVEKR